MIEEHKIWFEKLAKKRKTFAELSQDPDYKGMWEVLIKGIYSEDAHFIYELLQNAEDANATCVKFILKEEGLFFIHNGTILFSVTDIDNLNENGHINAITALGRTGKKVSETIGKFGIGFKAVFQYTKNPQIFDPNFKFKIYNYIVPELLKFSNNDVDYDNSTETLFYFPFIGENEETDNKKVKSRKEAYNDILKKLKSLDKPTLFLSNIREINWQIDFENNSYKKVITETQYKDNIKVDKVILSPEKMEYLILTRSENESIFGINLNYSYSVGFKIEDKTLKAMDNPYAFCFFPTKQKTNINFLIHAPFLLNSNRESIPERQNLKIKNDSGIEETVKENFNEILIKQLANLAADSLLILKDLKLINDNIVEIIPYKKPEDDFFAPFYYAIKEKFENEELLPTKDGSYAKKENAYWASVSKLPDLFTNEHLSEILQDYKNSKWVFVSKGRDEVMRVDKELADYIESITKTWLNEKDLLTGWSYTDGKKQNGINSKFIEKQNDEWLFLFYKWISETEGRKNLIIDRPFFINENRKAVPAYSENNKVKLYLPENGAEGYQTLNSILFNKTNEILLQAENLKDKSKKQNTTEKTSLAVQFYEKFGIREHTVADEIEGAIEEMRNKKCNPELFLRKAFKYYSKECPQDKIDAFILKIRDLPFIPYYNANHRLGMECGTKLFYPTPQLKELYEQNRDTKFVNIERLINDFLISDIRVLDDFLKKIGVKDKDPDLKDRIYEIIIPRFQDHLPIDAKKSFITLLQYYRECNNEVVDQFIEDIKKLPILLYKNDQDNITYRGIANDLYFPNPDLKEYFQSKPDTKFVDLENYFSFITAESERKKLKEFLFKLGVHQLPLILRQTIPYTKASEIEDIDGQHLIIIKKIQPIFDKFIDGCPEILKEIIKKKNFKKSILLWDIICRLNNMHENLEEKLKGKHWLYNEEYQYFETTILKILKTEKWIVNKNEQFVSPNEISINELHQDYNLNFNNLYKIETLLGFKASKILTKEQIIGAMFESEEEAKEAKIALIEKRAMQTVFPTKPPFGISQPDGGSQTKPDNNFKKVGEIEYQKQNKNSTFQRTIENLNDLHKEFSPKPTPNKNKEPHKSEIKFDEDEEFAKGIEDLKKNLEIKKSRADLAENINKSTKYSYDWFKAYLMLLATYGEKQDNQKQKSISFQEIKPYKTDNKYFLLSGANSYISSEIENAEEFKVSLVFGEDKKENIIVEGVSKRGQDLLIYCREPMPNNIISRLSNIFKVEINFTPVINLLYRLNKAFTNVEYIDPWQDIQKDMPSLEFIYGPPGTGKTTTLCKKIATFLYSNKDAKILVLTPTNKAADVICKKLKDLYSDISVLRLSSPTDPELEVTLYRDVLDYDDIKYINVVASTIHRLPYFEIKGKGLLFQYEWDYVIFDESSMAGLHYITFALMALYKSNPKSTFLIAGDPKQIPPIFEIDDKDLENFDFQDENIYKMINLESFNPDEQNIREIDTIKNLKIQYRSVEYIGQLFSELSYSALLKHKRKIGDSKPLPEEIKKIISSNVTFIDIPLDDDNSLYKVSKLFYSSYQIYCAILVAEIVKYFDAVNNGENWTIGLITPYKAQAVMINKLVTSYGISENVKVYSDTVHGFQGDECDIIFFICNPNNYYYTDHEKSLLSKEYIYNVAISRAKDYLVILHPFSIIRNNKFINKIDISYRKNFGNAQILKSIEIETLIFNDAKYIEKNSYISGHDSVNVFGLSEMKYFIKANDTTIDIQIRDLQKDKTQNKLKDEINLLQIEVPIVEVPKKRNHFINKQFEKNRKNKRRG